MKDPAAIRLAAESLAFLDRYISTPRETLHPGYDIIRDRVWSVIPVTEKITVKRGRGRDTTVTEVERPSLVAVSDDYLWLPYDEEHLAAFDLTPYHMPWARHQPFPWLQQDAEDYCRNRAHARSTQDIFEELRDIFMAHVEYPDQIYYDLLPLYVMQTYTFPIWPQTGYLHLTGTKDSGKSRTLDVLEMTSYNAWRTSNTSTPTLFRRVAGSPGVVLVDEAEDWKSDRGQEIRNLLLSGYDRSGRASRMEKGPNETWVPVEYPTYAPKAIASIAILDPVLASRSIVIPMLPAIKRIDEMPTAYTAWSELRNDLYVWALQTGKALRHSTRQWDEHIRFSRVPTIRNRAWQVSRPYLVVASHLSDTTIVERIAEFLVSYYDEQAQRTQDVDRALLLLRCLPRVLATKPKNPNNGMYAVGLIRDTVLDYLDPDQHEFFKTRQVHNYLTNLKFLTRKNTKGGMHYLLDEDYIRAQFTRRNITPFDEDVAWAKGATSYTQPPPDEPDEDMRLEL